MRRPRYITFECQRGHRKDWLLETNDDGSPIYEVSEHGGHEVKPMCLTCHLDNREGGVNIESEEMLPVDCVFDGYVKTIVKGNSDFNERERERLEKRQDDHWKRQGRDEAIDRERTFLKKQGVLGGVR